MTHIVSPIQPYELDKPLRRGMEDIVRRVVATSAVQGVGQDIFLRVYMAGMYHGLELSGAGPVRDRPE